MITVESVKSYIESLQNTLFQSDLTDVQRLSGGLVNYVYRVRFQDSSTCILKYYPDYLASNESISMSQGRYFIEKNALVAFENKPWKLEYPESKVKTPRVIHFDDEKFLIIMEDAGSNSKTLLSILSNSSSTVENYDELLSDAAREIFIFLNYISVKSNIKPRTHQNQFENKATVNMIKSYVKNLCIEQSNELNLQKEMEPYLTNLDKLFKPSNDEEAVFVFGDLWPNSILFDLDKRLIWFIDWEMARFGTRLGDLSQLMANLWTMKQNEQLFDNERIDLLMRYLQLNFFSDKNLDWRFNSEQYTRDEFVVWIASLVKEEHWKIDDQRSTILKAIQEVENYKN